MQEFAAFLTQPKAKMPFSWPGSLKLASFNPIPRRFRTSRRQPPRRLRSRSDVPEKENVTALKTSFNPLVSIRQLRRRRWTVWDLQHVIVFAVIVFSLCILPSAPLAKTAAMTGLTLLLLMPITQQFFLPSLPIWTYLFYFFSSRYIPVEYRPHIWVKVLPALENVLYGANLSNILSSHVHPILDILAWVPYGLGHFSMPLITSILLFLFAAPGTTPVFARAFGYISMLGVTTALVFPCTPPWYEKAYGLAPAHYGMQGSPAGLARVDELLGVDMYTTSFTTAPVPFGAFPSLHAADATIEALFLSYCFPRFRAAFIGYVGWLWWATMYLNHHYAVDLVAGSLIAAIAYYIARSRFLPRRQLDKNHRWEYDYVEFGERPRSLDEEYGYGLAGSSGFGKSIGLGLLDRRGTGDSDGWTIGSSSSFNSLSHGESGSSTVTSPGSVSPAIPGEDFGRHVLMGMTPQGDVWDGGRVGNDSELHEVVVVR